MDNNFVHIDELFKKGLSGGEEQEQSGAWLNMKELLDKEMPEGGAWRTRRPYRRYLTTLLILLALGGGAYVLNHQYHFISRTAGNNTIATATPAATGIDDHIPSSNSITNSEDRNNKAIIAGAAKPSVTANNKAALSKNDIIHKSAAGQPVSASRKEQNRNTVSPAAIITSNNKPSYINNNNATYTTKEPGAKSPMITTADVNSSARTKSRFDKKDVNNTSRELVIASNENKIYQDESGNILKLKSDSMDQVSVFEHSVAEKAIDTKGNKIVKHKIVSDTLNKQKVLVQRLVALSPLETAALKQLEVSPVINAAPLNSGALYASGERAVKLITLSDYKVKSKTVTPVRLKEIIGNTGNHIGSMFDGTKKYYVGIISGGNYSFGKTQALGLHIGIGGYYAINERLTLGVEALYSYRSFGSYKLLDPYTTYDIISQTEEAGNWNFNYKSNQHNDYYKIDNLQTISVPLYLNYSFGRVSVSGGVNIAYAFKMHPVLSNDVITAEGSTTSTTSVFPLQPTSAEVAQADFRSRCGLGYVLGIAYDINRKLSIDARATQVFWDNATGNMSQELSRATFRLPTLQLGLSFYFGRRDKIVYLLDNRK